MAIHITKSVGVKKEGDLLKNITTGTGPCGSGKEKDLRY